MFSRTKGRPRLAVLAAFAAILSAGQAHASFNDIYSSGHADINLSYDSGSRALLLNYEFASNAVVNGVALGSGGAGERDADTITVLLGANTLGTGPAGLPSPFGGSPLWTLPQTSQLEKPFLGVGAESIDPGLFQNDTLTLTLSGIATRPVGGEFILWQLGGEATPFMNSADGFSAADFINLLAGGHDHYTYGFTQEGVYDLVFTARGTLLNGTALTTTETYRFQVGSAVVPEPGSLTLMGLGLGAIGLAAVRRGKARPVAPDAA